MNPTHGGAHDPAAQEVLQFWFGDDDEYGKRRKCWFEKSAAFDLQVCVKFSTLLRETVAGRRNDWLMQPADCLARIIVLDQFPRHMFRNTAQAFSHDRLALDAARHAVERGYDRGRLPVERLFLYLPFEHSEALVDQLKACTLIEPLAAYPETADAYPYALAHRDIIQRFGRFPHRNAALGRDSTREELEFLTQPGSSF